ncbi:hypothetical protein [Alteribacter lacisalsi]|nr:hypothetical protein [Alteribacter lacisalsi]
MNDRNFCRVVGPVTGLTHKDSYGDIAADTLIIPTIAVFVAIIMGALGIY